MIACGVSGALHDCRATAPAHVAQNRVTPQQVFVDFRAREDLGAEFAGLAHRWVNVVRETKAMRKTTV